MKDVLARGSARRLPEDSIALRAAVLGAVLTGLAALTSVGAVSLPAALLFTVLLLAGYSFSYVYRHPTSWGWVVKIVLTLAAIVAVTQFFGALRQLQTVDEARFPLANLFLAVQVLHGFDLPARKDLNFSLGSSLALMAIAATLSQDMAFAFYLVVYFAFVMAALTLSHRSELGGSAAAWMTADGKTDPGRARFPWDDIGRAVLPVTLCGALIFMLMPQSVASQYFALPFSLGEGIGADAAGGIMNPGGGSGTRSSGEAYHGFDDRMDLNVRGDLGDQLVMRVRSSAPAMWKGIVFGEYDGRYWKAADPDAAVPAGDAPPYQYPVGLRSLGPRVRISQTYYVEAEQPNVIFAAGQPDTIWYEGGVSIDALGGVRTPSTLTPGTVYSVVSTRGSAPAEELRELPQEPPPDHIERYLELPDSVPDRVGELARSITRGESTDVDKVLAIEDYLRRNYEYSLDSPVPPAGRDAVDHFLFDADVGFCEQFASATAVMLRSLRIPARVVAGYAVGRRNALSGYYEVRSSDAHAWVEVWFPNYGWYEFDPTFAIPKADGGLERSIPLVGAISALWRSVRDAGPLGQAVAAAITVALAAFAARAGWRASRRRRGRGRAPLPPGAGPVTAAFRRFEDALATAGRPRAPGETAREAVARAARAHGPMSRTALQVFEVERYGPLPPRDEDVATAVEELDRLSRAVRETP
ncbi:MAG TPA: DUF3488 and transglutaminase-like domain-containing protein [Actinomycetota bacterium]|nr:DUF3488 and transglutaminase-like domain-containing protein [Actinomycetota bacterium]